MKKGFVPIPEKRDILDTNEKFMNFLHNFSEEFGVRNKENYNKFGKEKYILGVSPDHKNEVLKNIYLKNLNKERNDYFPLIKEFLEKKGYYHLPSQKDIQDSYRLEILRAQSLERTNDKSSK